MLSLVRAGRRWLSLRFQSVDADVDLSIPTINYPPKPLAAGVYPATIILLVGAEARRQTSVDDDVQLFGAGGQADVLRLGHQHLGVNFIREFITFLENLFRHRLVGYRINRVVIRSQGRRHAVRGSELDYLFAIHPGEIQAHRIINARIVAVEQLRNKNLSLL